MRCQYMDKKQYLSWCHSARKRQNCTGELCSWCVSTAVSGFFSPYSKLLVGYVITELPNSAIFSSTWKTTYLPGNQGLRRNLSITEKQVCENRDDPALGSFNWVQLFWSFVLSLSFLGQVEFFHKFGKKELFLVFNAKTTYLHQYLLSIHSSIRW